MVKVVQFKFQQCLVPLIMCLVKGSLKQHFLDINLTTFLEVRKFGNTSLMRVIFFLKLVTASQCVNKQSADLAYY